MKLGVIITEYPKTTETFIMRDVLSFSTLGSDIKIFHLTHFNKHEILHPFAAPTKAWANDYAYFASADVIGAVLHYMRRRPGDTARLVRDIVVGARRDPVMMLKSLFILPKSMRIARELADWEADHVHAAYAGHPATCAWIIRRLTGIGFSVSSHAHDLFETQALLAEKLPEADFVRTISQFNRSFILRHVPVLAERPPLVIHVGVAFDAPEPPPRALGGDFRPLYVGSLEGRKGVDLLLEAVARLAGPPFRLDIVGDGPERGRLEALSARLGLADRAVFHGRLDTRAVQQAMDRASVLVVPSRIGPRNQTEGLPTVIVEAFSRKLPVVATRLTGIPEIVVDGETGLLFPVDDRGALALAMERVRSDPAAAYGMAEAGHALVRREFDQRRNAEALFKLMEAASRRASSGPARADERPT